MTRSFKITAAIILVLVLGIASWVFIEQRDTQDTNDALAAPTQTQTATPPEDEQYRDDIGTFTVKCEVTSEKSPGKTLGYMVGNASESVEAAIENARLYESKFIDDSVFEECESQEEYIPTGAYNPEMQGI